MRNRKVYRDPEAPEMLFYPKPRHIEQCERIDCTGGTKKAEEEMEERFKTQKASVGLPSDDPYRIFKTPTMQAAEQLIKRQQIDDVARYLIQKFDGASLETILREKADETVWAVREYLAISSPFLDLRPYDLRDQKIKLIIAELNAYCHSSGPNTETKSEGGEATLQDWAEEIEKVIHGCMAAAAGIEIKLIGPKPDSSSNANMEKGSPSVKRSLRDLHGKAERLRADLEHILRSI